MINLVLSGSQQTWNKCVLGDSEEDHVYLILEKVAQLLKCYDVNVYVIPKDVSGNESETLFKVVQLSNDFIAQNGGSGYHLDVHTNAGAWEKGATGYFISEGGKAFIQKIHKQLCAATPWNDGGVQQANFYVLKKTIAIAGLIEIASHDEKDEAQWIHNNIDFIAEQLTLGIGSALGLEFSEQKDFKLALKFFQEKKILESPDYWLLNAQPGKTCKGEWVKNILLKAFDVFMST